MASPDPPPTSSCTRKLQHGLAGRGRDVKTDIGQTRGLQLGERVSLRFAPSLTELTDLRNCVQSHPHLTNPVTLPSTSQQSRTPTTSDCLCLEALITVPHARPFSSNGRSHSSGEPRAALNCLSAYGQHTILHGSLNTHFPLQERSGQNQTPCSQERGNGQPWA